MNRVSLSILLDFIQERTGLFYENGRRELIGERLLPLIHARGLDSFIDYYYLLKFDKEAESEWRKVESVLAVNESYFWREFDQIKAVVEVILPRLLEKGTTRPVRIWHAACATGEEPYTMVMAMLMANLFPMENVEIIATDFNSEALANARAGIYRSRSFRSIPDSIRDKFFTPTTEGRLRLVDGVRRYVHFSHLNLVDGEMMGRMKNFDIIFCRNVFIYFRKEAIQKTIKYFHNSLMPHGYLFTGAAESLLRITTQFELVDVGGAFAYQKLEPSEEGFKG